jgi:hypothetical protein
MKLSPYLLHAHPLAVITTDSNTDQGSSSCQVRLMILSLSLPVMLIHCPLLPPIEKE